MHSISNVLSNISVKDWRPELGKIEYWYFEKLLPQINSDSCLFTVRARVNQNMLPGFENICAIWHVDVADLQRPEIKSQSDPETAYINFIKVNFSNFMADAARKMAKAAALRAGIILPKLAEPKIVDGKHKRQMEAFNNLKYSYKQRRK